MNLADQERLREWMAQASVIGMICLSITAPAIAISASLPYFKVEQLLIPIVLAVYLWLLFAGVAHTIHFNGMFLVGLLYFICNFVSMSYGASILGHPLDPRDYYELPKVWLPVAFFTITYEAELSESALRRLMMFFSFAALLVCLYAWGQFFALGFTYKLNPHYSGGGHIDVALAYARRVYSTAGNANLLAALMTWSVIVFTLAALFRLGSRLGNALMAVASLVTLVMTGSRSGLLAASLGFVFLFALLSRTGRRGASRLVLLILLVGAFAGTFGIVATSNQRTLERFQTVREPLRIDGLRQRLDYLWPVAWADFIKSPIVGHGPGKSFLPVGVRLGGTIDCEYLNVLREQGILGLLVFLLYYLFPLYLITRGQRALRRTDPALLELFPGAVTMTHFGFILIATALFFDIWMATYYTPMIQSFLWLWIGVAGRSARTVVDLSTKHSPAQSAVASPVKVLALLKTGNKETVM